MYSFSPTSHSCLISLQINPRMLARPSVRSERTGRWQYLWPRPVCRTPPGRAWRPSWSRWSPRPPPRPSRGRPRSSVRREWAKLKWIQIRWADLVWLSSSQTIYLNFLAISLLLMGKQLIMNVLHNPQLFNPYRYYIDSVLKQSWSLGKWDFTLLCSTKTGTLSLSVNHTSKPPLPLL